MAASGVPGSAFTKLLINPTIVHGMHGPTYICIHTCMYICDGKRVLTRVP